jgi:hypothetical protein
MRGPQRFFFDNAWCAKHCVEINDVLHATIQANAPLPQTIKLQFAKPHQPSTNST